MSLFRRIGLIAALLAAAFIVTPVSIYADDELPETEIVAAEDDEAPEEDVPETEVIDETTEETPEVVPPEDTSEETPVQVEEPSEDSETSVTNEEASPEDPVQEEPKKSAFELAAERLRGCVYADLSDLKIPEAQEDALFGFLAEQEIIGSGVYLSFIADGGYIIQVELLPEEYEEEQEETENGHENSTKAVNIPATSDTLASTDVNVSPHNRGPAGTDKIVSEDQPTVPEKGAVDGTAQFISVLLMLSECVRRALHLL